MTIWQYWKTVRPSKSNLRMLVPEQGWVAYEDRADESGKILASGIKDKLDSTLINVLNASNFLCLTGAGASFCAKNAMGSAQAPSMSDLWASVEAAVGTTTFKSICDKFSNAKIETNIEKLLSLCKIFLQLNDAATDENAEIKTVRDFVLSLIHI